MISDLEASYPKEKLDEISTSFCFICLLHLANERGLKIEGDALDINSVSGADGPRDRTDDADQPVCDIWGLKVGINYFPLSFPNSLLCASDLP